MSDVFDLAKRLRALPSPDSALLEEAASLLESIGPHLIVNPQTHEHPVARAISDRWIAARTQRSHDSDQPAEKTWLEEALQFLSFQAKDSCYMREVKPEPCDPRDGSPTCNSCQAKDIMARAKADLERLAEVIGGT